MTTAEWSSYVLQAEASSTPYTRTVLLAPDRHLHVVALGSLEGWGVISEEFSTGFLDNLLRQCTDVPESALADSAPKAFQESLSRHKVEYPPWSSAQYVAALIDGNTLRSSWIGDMHLIGWNSGRRYVTNNPHMVKGVDVNKREQRAVLRSLGLHSSESEERKPEVGVLHKLEHPTILFLGNHNPETALASSESLKRLQMSRSVDEFKQNCKAVDRAMEGLFVHGMFLFV
jgi:hypothetical protein